MRVNSVFIKPQRTIETILLFSGMTLAFFTQWIGYSANLRGEDTGLYTFRYNIIGYGLILLAGIIAFFRNSGGVIWQQHRYRIWLCGYLGLVTIMAARSFLEGMSILSVCWNSITYLIVIIIFIDQSDEFWLSLNRVLVIHATLAVIYCSYILLSTQMSFTGTYLTRNAVYESDLILTRSLMYGVPFLIFTYSVQSCLGRTIAVIGLLEYLLVAVLGQNRGTTIFVLLILSLAAYIWTKTEQLKNIRSRILLVALLLFGAFLYVWHTGWVSQIGLQYSWEALLRRSTTEGSFISSSMQDYRFYETTIVAGLMSWDQWLLGAGVSGEWSSPYAFFGEIRTMVHIGYMHLIFKGGVFMLLLFIIFPLGVGWLKFITGGNVWTLAAGAIMVMYSFNLCYGGYLNPQNGLVLLYLCAGRLAGYSGENDREDTRS